MLLIFGLRAVNLCVIILLSASSDVSEGSVPEPAPEPLASAFNGIPTGPTLDASLTHAPGIASITGTPEHPVRPAQILQPSPRIFYSLPLNSGTNTGSSSVGSTGTDIGTNTVRNTRPVPVASTPVAPAATSIGSPKPAPVLETSSAIPAPTSLLEATSGISPQGETKSTGVTSRSYLLLLAGNATVVRLREKDFAKYLKLNLAARLSLEYDDVRVNQVLVAPSRLVVNVSVVSPRVSALPTGPGRRPRDGLHGDPHGDGPHGDSPLHKMADTNATLLELSGEEYRIMRLVSLHPDPPVGGDLHIQKQLQDEATYSEGNLAPRSGDSRRHFDSVYIVPVLVGALCLAIVFAISLRLTAKRHYNRFWVLPKMLPKMLPKTNRRVHRILEAEDHLLPTYLAPPAVIYSGPFADHAASSRLHWLQVEETSSKLLGANLHVDITTPKHSQLHSPSKLHIFSCRPGAVVIPLRYNHSQQSLRGNGFPLG